MNVLIAVELPPLKVLTTMSNHQCCHFWNSKVVQGCLKSPENPFFFFEKSCTLSCTIFFKIPQKSCKKKNPHKSDTIQHNFLVILVYLKSFLVRQVKHYFDTVDRQLKATQQLDRMLILALFQHFKITLSRYAFW